MIFQTTVECKLEISPSQQLIKSRNLANYVHYVDTKYSIARRCYMQITINSLMFEAYKLDPSPFPFCPVSGQVDKEPNAPSGKKFKPFRPCRHSPYALQPNPPFLTVVKTPSQSPFSALSSHFGTAREPLCSPQKAHYVRSKPFHTFLVCVCGIIRIDT